MIEDKLEPIHPTEILVDDFMIPMDLSILELAESTGISFYTLNNIIENKLSLNDEIALKLSKFFGLSEDLWINLQKDYDERIKERNNG